MHHKFLLHLIFLFLISFDSYAFKLSPMKAEFSASGKKATQSFRIINTTDKKIKVEAEMLTREIDKNNKETRKETKNFTIYPPILEVDAGKSRVVRVSYIGSAVKSEDAYRFVVRQFPDSKDKKKENGAQINILFEYVASIYITPKNAKSNLSVLNAKKLNNHLVLNIKNNGTKHTLLRNYKLELSQGKLKKTLTFDDKNNKELATQNILAGLERKIVITDNEFSTGKLKAIFKKID